MKCIYITKKNKTVSVWVCRYVRRYVHTSAFLLAISACVIEHAMTNEAHSITHASIELNREKFCSACDKARVFKPSGFFVRFDCDFCNYFFYFSILIYTILIFSFILSVLLIIMDENQTLKFIESYKAAKLLWDANHTDYCNKIKLF